MAAPNLLNLTTVTAKEICVLLGGSVGDILANAAASGKVLKVNGIRLVNFDGSVNYDATVNYVSATPTTFVHTYVTVPAKAAVRAMDKEEIIYLEEGTKLSGFGSTASKINAIISYEELS